MNELHIPFIASLNAESTPGSVSEQLDKLAPQSLDHLLWSNDGYYPKVQFKIGHHSDCIFLKFTVSEDDVQMVYNQLNDPVYKDTCVEFFISFDNDTHYYNLEFNGAGNFSVGYGSNKFDRADLPVDVISAIKTQAKLWCVNEDFVYRWELVLVIPASIFVYNPNIRLKGLPCRLNFYKCGDDLPKPHFVAWNNIETEQPNFHLPEFFGKGLFLNELN
jgi:hypothetical protein